MCVDRWPSRLGHVLVYHWSRATDIDDSRADDWRRRPKDGRRIGGSRIGAAEAPDVSCHVDQNPIFGEKQLSQADREIDIGRLGDAKRR
jgi:hypothetical protein